MVSLLLAGWLSIGADPAAAQSPDVAKGANVTRISTSTGEWRQTGPRSWVALKPDGSVFSNWDELSRDEWSVYLTGRDQAGTRVRIDLRGRKVMLNNPVASGESALSDILTAQAEVTGLRVNRVATSTFEWRQTGAKIWVTLKPDGTVFSSFDEASRDQWSVYLMGREQAGMKIHIDLFQGKVFFTNAGESGDSFLADVLSARADPGSANAPVLTAAPAAPAPPPAQPVYQAPPQQVVQAPPPPQPVVQAPPQAVPPSRPAMTRQQLEAEFATCGEAVKHGAPTDFDFTTSLYWRYLGHGADANIYTHASRITSGQATRGQLEEEFRTCGEAVQHGASTDLDFTGSLYWRYLGHGPDGNLQMHANRLKA